MHLAPGTRLGVYEVISPLGAGGMGEVYLARDTRLDREVALKVLPSRMAQDSEAIARFRREALAIASLNHPNIATVFGFEEIPGGPMVLVLEHVEGRTLSARLQDGAMAPEEALRIGAQIAEALEAAHERGVIHRDVKPGNVMIGPRGIIKVLDFGLARRTAGIDRAGASAGDESAVDLPAEGVTQGSGAGVWSDDAATIAIDPAVSAAEDATVAARPASPFPAGSFAGTVSLTGMTVGTPGYMSPEQVRAGDLDERTDLFALGCVLYESLAGRRPFTGSNAIEVMRATLEAAPDLAAIPARTPARARELVAQCLEKDPARRPAGMRAVRVELEEILGIRRALALRAGDAPAALHNLPTPVTSFVGRERTLLECSAALDESRLLSLVGMGGSGKTRLALRLAESRLDSFPDGVWFVDVAPLTEPERVVEALATALEVREEPGRTLLQGAIVALESRTALLVLDNAETLPEACAALASQLLRACPRLRVLVTTREPLALEGEAIFTVPVLEVPDSALQRAAELADIESVRLFVDRASAALPGFELGDSNAGSVAEICRRLDGVPLALELAAARVRMLGIDQIRARLDDRFKLLARSGTGAPSRQQTVLAVVQWSWDHLLAPEQDLMRRLAVFTGGWTLERAAAVCSANGDEFETLDLLTRLVERSLVVVQRAAHGGVRYRFLESVWRFALARLESHTELRTLRERHLTAYLSFAERAESAMRGAGLQGALQELKPEEENMLGAFAWCVHADDGVQRGLRLASAFSRFWSVFGAYALGRRVLEEALARDTARELSSARTVALVRAAGFALMSGDHAGARLHIEESLAASRAAGDKRGIARALAGLCVTAMWLSRYQEALRTGEEALELYRELNEPRGVAMALHNLGTIESALKHPDYGRVRMEAALELLRACGDKGTEALCLSGLASSLLRVGDPAAARIRLLECLALLEELGMPRESFTALEVVAEWLLVAGRAEESARMLGSAAGIRLAMGVPVMPHEREDVEHMQSSIEAAIGEDRARRSSADGASLSREQAMAEAKALLGSAA